MNKTSKIKIALFFGMIILFFTGLVNNSFVRIADAQDCAQLPVGLLNWWDADDVSGTTANDIWNDNNGTLHNGASISPGKVGSAFIFDGVNDSIVAPVSPDLSSAGSIEFWMKPSTFNIVGSSAPRIIAPTLPLNNNATAPYQVLLYPVGSGQGIIRVLLGNNSVVQTINSSTIMDTFQFYHVVVTWNGLTVKIFINGVEDVSVPQTVIPFVTNQPLNFGSGPIIGYTLQAGVTRFTGLIDELSIYKRALTLTEVEAIYNAESSGKCKQQECAQPPAGLVSWWDGDTVSGVTASDIHGGNDGTLFNGATIVPGKVGNAFSFDGIDDQISMGDVLDFGLGSFSSDAWVTRQYSSKSMRVIGTFNTGSPGWDFSIRSNGKLILFLSGNGSTSSILQSVSTDVVPMDGQFHHIAATVDRVTNDISLFIDGVETSYDEKNTIANFSPATNIASFTVLTVGRRLDGFNPYKGVIDELDIFDKAIGVGEIQAIFLAGYEGKCKDPLNQTPTANAGSDQSVYVSNTVTLDGSGSSDVDGELLTYTWAFTERPTGSIAVLSDPHIVNPTFTVDKAGTYVVSLIVNDGTVNSATDTVTISTQNSAPMAEAGADQTPHVTDTVILNGAGSTDVDGDLLTYMWTFNSKPNGSTATLSDVTAVNPTFTIDKAGTYMVSLIVNDGTVNSPPDTVTISTLNSAPVANAGPDQTPHVTDTVALNGAVSTDVDGDLLTYTWTFTAIPAGSNAVLDDVNAVNPIFTVDKAGTYVVSLIVNDGTVDSNQMATVTISTLNSAPVANAGQDQMVYVNDPVTLDGSGSTDVDGDLLAYTWAFTAKPADSTATLNDPHAVNPTFTADKAGTYVMSLMVNDGTVDSQPDTVVISTVNTAPIADAGPDQLVIHIGSTVQLDGSQSYDLEGDAITYQWAFTSRPAGSSASLTNADSVTPTFVADVRGEYVIQLVVTDAMYQSNPDTVVVNFTNITPVANAGTGQSVYVGDTVTMDGSGSTDANGDTLSFVWALTSVPAGSSAAIVNPTAEVTSFVPDIASTYVVQLIVNDGTVDSDPVTIVIQASSGQSDAIEAVQNCITQVSLLSPGVFKNANMQNTMINKFNAVIANIEAGNYADALGQLQNDILKKTDGCANTDDSDKNDWITTCAEQGAVYPYILVAIDAVEALVQ
ncbi:MAG: hypothetical protein F9K48_03745 [Candidatus Brocadia sp.]|nr:MAG: hypothetical protein F9K48_03745 [Candidatus Brocadia sp.]